MNILYIARSTIPSREANSIQVMRMCQAFAQNGHKVMLLLPNKQQTSEGKIDNIYTAYGVTESFTIQRLPSDKKTARFFFEILEIKKVFAAFKPDLVYGRCSLGCTLSCLNGYPTIYESHLPIWTSSIIKKYGFLLLAKNKNFKRLVVISKALKNIYINNNIITSDKVYVAHDGADEVTDLNATVKLSGDNRNLNVGYAGHLYTGKGMEIIAQVAPLAKEYNFHIVGGTEKDIAYWKSAIQSDNVFFYGFQQQKIVSQYINSFDICLLPNQKVVLPCGKNDHKRNISDFTSPLKMFEYMAHKKAIITSDLPVLREVLNESNAILVNCDDIHGWINALEDLRDVQKREKLAKKAYSDFINEYTWKNRAKLVLQGQN